MRTRGVLASARYVASWLALPAMAALLAACTLPGFKVVAARVVPRGEVAGGPSGHYLVPAGIHKIRHVIVVMQENRSFDHYFGTFPGADGIPMVDGQPTVCVPDPQTGAAQPFHDRALVNGGGPHGHASAVTDIDHGAMDGFVRAAPAAGGPASTRTTPPASCAPIPT